MRPNVLGVIGLDAIGGSIAWQAVRAGVRRVIGYSSRRADLLAAARAGAITDAATSRRAVIRESELLILAVPPVDALSLLRQLSGDLREDACCTDVAPVKAPVVRAAAAAGLAAGFAGSHPLIELGTRGFAAAEPGRFRGAVVYVTPSGGHERPAREIADFWGGVLDAEPVLIDAGAHDAVVAWTAHLPVVAATALAAAYAARGPRGVTYGSAARAATVAAEAPLDTWRDVLLLNRSAVLDALSGLEDAAGGLRRALEDGDARALDRWLAGGATWRRELGP